MVSKSIIFIVKSDIWRFFFWSHWLPHPSGAQDRKKNILGDLHSAEEHHLQLLWPLLWSDADDEIVTATSAHSTMKLDLHYYYLKHFSLSHSLSSRENISEMMNWDVLSNFHINNFLRFFIFVLGLLWGRLQMKLRTLSTIPTFLTINFGLCRYFQKRESNPLPYLQQFARVIVFASINFRNNGASKIVKLRRQSNKYFFISKPTFEWISCSI